jgi:hypothetical protein
MAGLVPGIHVFAAGVLQTQMAGNKPGRDEKPDHRISLRSGNGPKEESCNRPRI